MKNKGLLAVVVLLAITSVISLSLWYRSTLINLELEKKIEHSDLERISTLAELERCLIQNQKYLKKELIDKYLESMINLRNKIDGGYTPTEKDISNFFERSEFIISNLSLLKLSKDKAMQYISFIESSQNLLKSFSTSSESEDNDL